MTICHEFGHKTLHPIVDKVARKGDTSHPVAKIEEQAESRGREILLPEEIVLEYIEEKGFINTKYLKKTFVREFSNTFNISLITAEIRLKELGFVISNI